ncbi:programmed cell death 1 ligand 1-like isoform X2 [Astatotilapia calliptera]|uniref:programmed cell death 1 ligand 1-like isoform X2 n=1 Tax=Astatotilapia calliptera TaxID=8154 RepID=UPI000E41320F|nr:programmed cell death 1 ligand 1-like isoform X2 [Astatotilapia calliptera]
MKCIQLIVIFGLFAERKTECPLSPGYFQETKPVQAVSGKNIILPCFPKFNLSIGHDILEWHFYEKEIYTFEKKGLVREEKYNNRLFTSTEELEKGNASIQLCDVKESDAGEYCCCIATKTVPMPKCTKMNLELKKRDQGEGHGKDKVDLINENIINTENVTNPAKTNPTVVGVVVVLSLLLVAVIQDKVNKTVKTQRKIQQ